MSPGISASVHWWRGWGRDQQEDLFWWRYRLGFVTVAIERRDLFAAYQKLRETIVETIRRDEEGK
jgi:hypothetical protein